jgi:23S rRNA pseudouridine1911/1915/1917 synthase
LEVVIGAAESGERIDRVLGARDLGFSRSRLVSWIADGRITLDGSPVKASARVRPGQRVVVRPTAPTPSSARAQDLPLTVLFEDAHVLVIDKPPGMVVHPAPGHADGTLVNAILHHVNLSGLSDPTRPGIVHRLDRDTSGVLVVAKTETARESLVAQLQRHTVEREYRAIVLGRPPDAVTFDTVHGRHPRDRKRFSSRVTRGKRAVTHVRVLERLHGAALVACRLETGRTHQIRVHLADHRFPVLGDVVYGRNSRDPRIAAVARALGRQALHARVLGFAHPVTGEPVRCVAEPPEDFRRALAALRDG